MADSPAGDFPPPSFASSTFAPSDCRVCAVLERENAWLRQQVEVLRDQVASLADPLVLARVRVSVPSVQSPERKLGPRRLVKDELGPEELQKLREAEEAAKPPSAAAIEASFTEGA